MRIISSIIIFSLLIIPIIQAENIIIEDQTYYKYHEITSNRLITEDIVVIPSSDPYYGIIGSYIACWYDNKTSDTLLPLLVSKNRNLSDKQYNFINNIFRNDNEEILVLGESINTEFKTNEILGSPSDISLNVTQHIFKNSSSALIVPYGTMDDYELSLIASPLASYLNIPILLYYENEGKIQELCTKLDIKNCFLVGNINIELDNIEIIHLINKTEIQKIILSTIREKFGEINYLSLTNPSDVLLPSILNNDIESKIYHLENLKLTILGKEYDIFGIDTIQQSLDLSSEINRIEILCKIPEKNKHRIENIYEISPIISMILHDPNGNIAAYSSSLGYDIGEAYLDAICYNNPGNYSLTIKTYNGFKGGYFVQRGISYINTDINLSITTTKLEKPHFPLIPNLSILAPYLTSAHGGLIISDPDFALTTNEYLKYVNGSSAGPWYNDKTHPYNNQKVNYTIQYLENSLELLGEYSMLDNYLNNQGWLGILGDTNMIPMYYYSPSQQGIHEKGLPSDNPYSLNWNLSVGRIVSYDVSDVSVLISRIFFYEEICGNPKNSNDWHNTFNFIFGEGFGETGGLFHQVPYANEIEQYGFHTNVYGDLRNSRQMASLLNVYTGANYIEYLGHGDWFWFTPSMYGLDYYGKAIDISHAKDWTYPLPSLFLSSACLMGRIDGLQPFMNIGITMLHAGCNGFIGATRETGSEAGLETLENHLILDDYSIGEALRGEKRIDQELPTFYVRTLYGDPAFNPYEPNNGFSNQGRPQLIS